MKKITQTLFGLFLAGAFPALAQQFQHSVEIGGDDYGNRMLIDGSNVTVVGASNVSGSGYDLLIASGDINGNFTNVGMGGGAGNETARAIEKLSSGNTIVAGASSSFSPVPGVDDLLIVNLDNTGSPTWINVLGTDSLDRIFAVKEGNDGNIIVAGQTKQGDISRFNGLIAKLNFMDGSVIWSKSVGTQYTNEVIYDIAVISGLGYLIAGYTGVNVMGLNENFLVLLNEDGTKNAALIFGATADDDARSIINPGAGKLYIAGNTRNIGQGSGEAFLARLDVGSFPVITMDWFKTYGGTGNESLQRATMNAAGDAIIMVGSTNSFGTGGDAFAIEVDLDGVIQFAKIYGEAGADFFIDVADGGDGGYVAAGYSNSFGGIQNNLWVVGMASDGSTPCNFSDAPFVEETISNSVAYLSQSHSSLDDIVSTDSTLTPRVVMILPVQAVPTTTDICAPLSVDENTDVNKLNIYPNPAGDMLNFNFGVNASEAKGLIIYNALGAKVYETTLSNITSVFTADISHLANGFYTAVVFMNNDQTTAKFTVAK